MKGPAGEDGLDGLPGLPGKSVRQLNRSELRIAKLSPLQAPHTHSISAYMKNLCSCYFGSYSLSELVCYDEESFLYKPPDELM